MTQIIQCPICGEEPETRWIEETPQGEGEDAEITEMLQCPCGEVYEGSR